MMDRVYRRDFSQTIHMYLTLLLHMVSVFVTIYTFILLKNVLRWMLGYY